MKMVVKIGEFTETLAGKAFEKKCITNWDRVPNVVRYRAALLPEILQTLYR
jgi:hypothetical protein